MARAPPEIEYREGHGFVTVQAHPARARTAQSSMTGSALQRAGRPRINHYGGSMQMQPWMWTIVKVVAFGVIGFFVLTVGLPLGIEKTAGVLCRTTKFGTGIPVGCQTEAGFKAHREAEESLIVPPPRRPPAYGLQGGQRPPQHVQFRPDGPPPRPMRGEGPQGLTRDGCGGMGGYPKTNPASGRVECFVPRR